MRAFLTVLVLAGIHSTAIGAPDAESLAKAKEHSHLAAQLYDLGKYLEAASEYEAAFRLSDLPGFLFNIGQAYRLAGKPKDALAAYQGFLRRKPEAAQRAEVEEHIDALQKTIEEENRRVEAANEAARKAAAEAQQRVVLQKPAPPPPRPWWKRGWVWGVIGGVAAVGVGVGVGLGVTLGTRHQTPQPDYMVTF
jgi:tetratricopeptide (TPR) repeat protein